MPSIRVRFSGGATSDQWTTDDLKRHFGTKKGEVPFIEYIDVFSDTDSRLLIIVVDPKRRKLRHQDESPDIEVAPGFDRPEHGQYAQNFDTDKTTRRIDINDQCREAFGIVSSGAGVMDLTIVYRNVTGQYVLLLDVERMADRKRMDRQDSLEDSRDPGFRMGRQIRQMGDNDPRT